METWDLDCPYQPRRGLWRVFAGPAAYVRKHLAAATELSLVVSGVVGAFVDNYMVVALASLILLGERIASNLWNWYSYNKIGAVVRLGLLGALVVGVFMVPVASCYWNDSCDVVELLQSLEPLTTIFFWCWIGTAGVYTFILVMRHLLKLLCRMVWWTCRSTARMLGRLWDRDAGVL